MTRAQMAEALEALALMLANRKATHEPPEGVSVHEWAYVCGLAGGAIMRLHDDLQRADPLRRDPLRS